MHGTQHAEFKELIGEKIVKVDVYRGGYEDTITFYCESGWEFHMYHDQDCCESVRIEDIDNNIDKLVGATILQAEESTSDSYGDEGCLESCTWTFYKITDSNANYYTIRWLGESNGYYSEEVSVSKYRPAQPKPILVGEPEKLKDYYVLAVHAGGLYVLRFEFALSFSENFRKHKKANAYPLMMSPVEDLCWAWYGYLTGDTSLGSLETSAMELFAEAMVNQYHIGIENTLA